MQQQIPLNNIIITSVCMNRNAFLLASVPEWLKLGLPVIIVDWSSNEPVRDTLAGYLDRISIVEVCGKDFFSLSKSKNLSYRAARHLHPGADSVLHFDCDVYATDASEFLQKHPLEPDIFYSGGVTVSPSSLIQLSRGTDRDQQAVRNRLGTFGTFLCAFALLEKVNMNDERMTGYGTFDLDLYSRMQSAGARWKPIRAGSLYHQPHGGRSANYRESDLEASQKANRQITKSRPWDRTFAQERQVVSLNGEKLFL